MNYNRANRQIEKSNPFDIKSVDTRDWSVNFHFLFCVKSISYLLNISPFLINVIIQRNSCCADAISYVNVRQDINLCYNYRHNPRYWLRDVQNQ